MNTQTELLKKDMRNVLENNILRFWIDRMTDNENGGYYGRIDGYDNIDSHAEKGAILNARILWAFSAAYRVLGNKEYLDAAKRAKNYIMEHFIDKEYGGVFWSLDYNGNPKDTKKQTYAIGFTIYGMSEFARATGDKEALDCAISLYHSIEEHAFDSVNNGYTEALSREWNRIEDMRLSDKDENLSKTMNTHLHVIEPYTNLYRVWKNAELKERLVNLLSIFKDKILNKETNHLDLFFDDEWKGKRNIHSYGHDIEASWLLHETALVLDDKDILSETETIVLNIASAADEGLTNNGAMIYEKWLDTDKADSSLQWWVQCENVIGHINLYQYFNTEHYLDIAEQCWQFIKSELVDNENGEWLWSINSDGTPNRKDDKAGFWKCPYHNTRMCLEIIERNF
ncbi:MAG: AGE family epimerase/isomerase [Prevotellaceae bacterium]|nr:AGE family epimerase/isomerase [Prevotellaceae bacterium]